MSNDVSIPTESASKRWLAATLGSLALIVAVNFFIAWRMDVFGLLRNAHGRALGTTYHERKAKYLLNEHYVPENFDALIVGASASVNWNSDDLTGYRFYNESLEGGDASEERILTERALKTGHFKVALVGLYPSLLQHHDVADGLDRATPSEAYGSLNSLGIAADMLRARIVHRAREFRPDGSHDIPLRIPQPMTPGQPKTPIWLDPQSLEDYRAIIENLQQHGTKVVYVIYPTIFYIHDYNAKVLQAFRDDIITKIPNAPIIDFDGPQDAAFRADVSNWTDDIHLTPKGSTALTKMINTRMHDALHDQ